MIRVGNRTFTFKAAAGAWGYGARGYPELLFSPRWIVSVLRHVPVVQWPGMAWLWLRLAFQTLLIWMEFLNTLDFVFTTPVLTAIPSKGQGAHLWLRPMRNGYAHGVLPNPGLVSWIAENLPSLKRRGIQPIVAIEPHAPGEARYMLELLAKHRDDIFGIELSPQAPRILDKHRQYSDAMAVIGIVEEALRVCTDLGWQDAFLVLKLTATHPWKTIIHWTSGRLDAIELVGPLPGQARSVGQFETATKIVARARKITHTPIIGSGGIHDRTGVLRMSQAGAAAVAIDTGFFEAPFEMSFLAHESRMAKTVIPQKANPST